MEIVVVAARLSTVAMLATGERLRQCAPNVSWLFATLAWLDGLRTRSDAERAIVGRIAAGDRKALHELYTRLGGRAYAVCLRVLHDREEAEDILQETFVEVWKRAKEFDAARGAVRSWLLTIARSRAINRYNARKSNQRTVGAASKEPIAASIATPLQLVEEQQTAARVNAALATLPDEQRQVIELAFYEGLSHSEIAEQTKLALGTIKTRIRLAMEKLARELGEQRNVAEAVS